MCLAVPVQVVEIAENNVATVLLDGVRENISVALLDEVAVGDYVIVHVGYALTRLSPAEAEQTLNLMREAGLFSAP